MAAAGALFLFFYLLWLWQPERQVTLHFENLVKSVENRKWNRFARLVADDYEDQWGLDKETILREAPEGFRHFFALSIDAENVTQRVHDNTARVECVLRIRGEGTAIAQMVRGEVNRIHRPYVFFWEKRSWKPWDWQLVRVENEQLNLERYRGPGGF